MIDVFEVSIKLILRFCFTSTLAKSRFSESESSLFELSRALAISPLKAMCGLTSQVLAKDFKTGFRLISRAKLLLLFLAFPQSDKE